MICLKPFQILLVSSCLVVPRVGLSQNTLIVDKAPSATSPLNIEAFTTFYDDHSVNEFTLDEIKRQSFQPLHNRENDRAQGLQNSKSVTWLNFTIDNRLNDTLSVLYNCNMHYRIQVYDDVQLLDDFGFYSDQNGRNLPMLKIAPYKKERYWVKVTNYFQSVLPLTSILITREAQLAGEMKDALRTMPLLIFCSAVIGGFFFMNIFAFYHYHLTRDKAYLFYALSVLILLHGSFMLLSNRFGLFGWTNHSLMFSYFIFYILFIDKMVDIRGQSLWGWRLVCILMCVMAFNQVISLLEHLYFKAPLFKTNLLYKMQLIPGMFLVVMGIWFVYRSTSPLKKFLICGMAAMVFLGFTPLWLDLYVAMELNALEAFVNFPPAWLSSGLIVENICFALALAYRHHLSEKEKLAFKESYAANLRNELILRTAEIEGKRQELEQQKIMKLTAEFQQKLKATEMSALRAQMNPHFIFNCLNSIKLYTLENNSAMAAEYLTRFSRLIRLVLENSQHEKITLAAELETLQLYVDMESMRFKNQFSYVQHVDEAIDLEYTEIPPMLIQPYIENAIWHGLMHRESRGTLTLHVMQPDDQKLVVVVCDDGVGRARTRALKSKSATIHKSAGLKLTSERIALINQRSQNETAVEVEDLIDHEGTAAGTKVTIIIPL